MIIGAGLAQKLGIRPGGSITLIAPKGNVTPFGTTPRIKTYTVAGTFRIGMTQYDTSFIFMPLDEAQLFFNSENGVSGIEVMVTDPDNDLAMLPRLRQAAGRTTRLVPWQETNSSFFEALQVERNVMFLILTLIILVAALNIVSGLIMLVKDKSRRHRHPAHHGRVARRGDAGVPDRGRQHRRDRHACWASSSAWCSAPISKASARACRGSPAPPCSIPPSISCPRCRPRWMPGEVTAVVVMALTLTFLATLYPSWRAARLDPVEALRYGEVLRLENVSRRYKEGEGQLEVFRDLNMSLQAGEIVALVGPSGAGKSSLLHMAGLLEAPSSGEIYIDGAAASRLPEQERTRIRRDMIGFVYQAHHLLPEFDALENVVMPQMIAGKTPRRSGGGGQAAARPRWGWASGSPTGRRNCRAASSSASPSPARWPTSRASFWPTSPPAISIRAPPAGCSTR